MKVTLYAITAPIFTKALTNLSVILDKLEKQSAEKKFDIDHLLTDRLYPDQFPFIRQVQICSDNAKAGVARLAGIEVPKMEDTEKTVGELKVRIQKTLDFISSVNEAQFEGAEDRQCTLPYFPGTYLTGLEYTAEYLLPNFFFHYTTAYAILRHNGIALGKADYIGQLSLKDVAPSV